MADKHKEKSPYKIQLFIEHFKAVIEKKPYEAIRWLKKGLEIDPQSRPHWYELGYLYTWIEQYDQAVEPLERAMELSSQWGSGWKWVSVYTVLGNAYHKLGQHDREMEVYEKGLIVLPDHPSIIRRLAIEYLSEGDTVQANVYLTKYRSKRKEQGWSQGRTTRSLGSIYGSVDDLTNAEKFYRRALDMDPEDSATLNGLAYLLIDHDINVDEGMELVRRALEIEPDEPDYLGTQGWGYYKQGKYQEAVDILQRAWNENPYYDHNSLKHLNKAKAAIVKQ